MEALLEELALSGGGLAFVWSIVFLGALVQGSIGFGLNLIVVPAIATVRPEVLPAASIILALPMTLGSAAREWSHVDRKAIFWTTLGRLPGITAGVWLVVVLAPDDLALVIGATVVFASGMSVLAPRIEITRASQAGAGLLGGLMGTSSSIGGPPMALLYQHESGPVMRSTLGATFLVGTGLSLLALVAAGEVRGEHWRFGIAMMPAVLLGLFASRYFHGWLERGWLRPCVLGFAALSGLAVLVRGLIDA